MGVVHTEKTNSGVHVASLDALPSMTVCGARHKIQHDFLVACVSRDYLSRLDVPLSAGLVHSKIFPFLKLSEKSRTLNGHLNLNSKMYLHRLISSGDEQNGAGDDVGAARGPHFLQFAEGDPCFPRFATFRYCDLGPTSQGLLSDQIIIDTDCTLPHGRIDGQTILTVHRAARSGDGARDARRREPIPCRCSWRPDEGELLAVAQRAA